jgi:sarcosine oxidase subunit gamma
MCVSGPDGELPSMSPLLHWQEYPADVIEIAALRGRTREIEAIATARGFALPGFGRAVPTDRWITLSVRPERWLILLAPTASGARVAQWQAACSGAGAAVDLSSAWSVLQISGPMGRELLARSCRVDLSEGAMPVGRAVATVMAQVAVIIVTTPSGPLVLTPSTMARHFREWLALSAHCAGLMPQSMRGAPALPRSSGPP